MTKKVWRKLFLRLFGLLVIAVILFIGIFFALVELVPFDQSKLAQKSLPSVVYARDDSVYMTFYPPGSDQLTYDQIPPNLRNAIVAIEDHGYWTQPSIDFKGILRSAFVDLWSHSYAQGASTIPEQLAKIVYLNDQKTLGRKFQQIVLGVQINRYFTKQEILAMYLNKVFLGENAVGVRDAAYRYYGIDITKNPNALTLDQAALLAGLPQAPTAYDPLQHPKAAIARRNQVLEAMAKYGYITEAAAKKAEAQPIGNLTYHTIPGAAWDTHPLFTNFLFDAANHESSMSIEALSQGGLKIYTTVDPKVQDAVETVFSSSQYASDFPGPTSGNIAQAAGVFMDAQTGDILGAAPSRKQGFVYYGLDRLYQPYSPGSSIKPVLEYGAAIESGNWGPNSILNNTPQNFGGYTPRNDEANAPAQLTMEQALAESQNVAAVWLLSKIGINTGADFAERLGIPITSQDRTQLGIAVGGLQNGVTAMQMVKAYDAYANGGQEMTPHLIRKIVNQNGDVLYQTNAVGKNVVSANVASVMTQMLQAVVQWGTGQPAQIPGWGVAGKTGTVQYDASSQGSHRSWIRNAWFDGYTPNIVGSVVVGYDQTDAEHHLTDIPHAPSWWCAKVWGDVMRLATAGQTPQTFTNAPASQPSQTQPSSTPVTGLSASWDSNIQALQLSWQSSVTDNVMYVIQRSDGTPNGTTGSQGNMNVIAQTNQTSITDPNAQPGMSYTYVVQAINTTTGQPYGPSASLTVNVQGPGGGPGNDGNATGGNATGNNTGEGPGGGNNVTNSPGDTGNGTGLLGNLVG